MGSNEENVRRAMLPNAFNVHRVCLTPASSEQPAVRIYASDSSRRDAFCSHLHTCLATPYCTNSKPTVYDFCREQSTHNGSLGVHALRAQARHLFSAIEEAAQAEQYPMAGTERIGRAAVLGYTGNVGHDFYLNGGMFDLFALHAKNPFDALLFNVDSRFEELLASRRESWQLSMLHMLFNSSSDARAPRFVPLRLRTPLCVDELAWKPPVLDFNHLSDSVSTATLLRLPPLCCRAAVLPCRRAAVPPCRRAAAVLPPCCCA